jgi:hypothetical protein
VMPGTCSTFQRERADGELSGGMSGEAGKPGKPGKPGKAGKPGEAEAGGTSEAGVPLTHADW